MTGFLGRWLREHGAGSRQVEGLLQSTLRRASRYPGAVSSAYPVMTSLLEWAAPAALLGQRSRASALSSEDFAALEHALQNHPATLVKLLYMLARTPAMEALYPDVAPPAPVHPLADLEPTIRARSTRLKRDFDVIVIGSGAGGGPLAWSLSEAGMDVAVVEAGALMRSATTQSALEKYYLTQGMIGSAEGMVLVLAGEAVGGTTVINSGTSLPPRPESLARWDELAGAPLSAELEPWFKIVHDRIGITVSPRELLDASAELVERGLAALGKEGAFVLPRNAPACEGKGRCCFGCPSGAKQSTDRSFLPQAVAAGATLLWETRALNIREDRFGAEVLVEDRDGRRMLRADKVVIAAGALSTPHLLRHNRLGSRWKQAGNHLKIHPASKVFAMMPEPLRHGGVPQGLGYHEPMLPRITLEGIHTPAAAAAPMLSVSGSRHREWMESYDRVATFGMMCRDRAIGKVRGQGLGRWLSYRLDPQDCRDLGAGLILTAKVMFAAGAERVVLPISGVNSEFESLQALRNISPDDFTPKNIMVAGFHPQGTAGVGRVVDSNLRVIGCENIYVADASVLPDSPGNNPQVSIMAFALRLADHLSQKR